MFTKVFRSFSPSKQIAYLALFIALSVACNSFLDIDVTASNKITFTYFICFYAGFLLGPVPGFIVGLLGDAIGFLIKQSGIYWLFGLTLGLFGFLSGIIMKYIPWSGKKGLYGKAAVSFAVCFLVITCFVNSVVNYFYAYIFIWEGVFKKAFWVWFAGRIAFQSVVYVINTALCFATLPLSVKLNTFRELQ